MGHQAGWESLHKCAMISSMLHEPLQGWRDDLSVKNIGCSGRDPGFDSQQPHSSTQPSLTSVLRRDLMPSSDFHGHQTCSDIHTDKTFTYKLKWINLIKNLKRFSKDDLMTRMSVTVEGWNVMSGAKLSWTILDPFSCSLPISVFDRLSMFDLLSSGY